jgi:hypothetical protein
MEAWLLKHGVEWHSMYKMLEANTRQPGLPDQMENAIEVYTARTFATCAPNVVSAVLLQVGFCSLNDRRRARNAYGGCVSTWRPAGTPG